MIEDNVHPETRRGDPFVAASGEVEPSPRACLAGWVHLGELVEDAETGEEYVRYVAVRCKRC